MVGCFTIQCRTKILYTQYLDKKLGELIQSFSQLFYFIVHGRIFKQLCIIISYKAHTACAWHYYVIAATKILYVFAANLFCFAPETCIKCRLPATGLIC